MAKSSRRTPPAINSFPISFQDVEPGDSKQEIVQTEVRSESLAPHGEWNASATGSVDTAIALVKSPTDVRTAINPEENESQLV